MINTIKKNSLSIVLFAVLVSGMVTYYKYDIRKTQRILDELNKDYPIISISERISGVITRIDHPYPKIFRNNPHHAFVVIDNSIKKRIRAGYALSRSLTLDEVLEEGELIIKEAGNNIFSIYKMHESDTLKYVFELSDDLGYPLKGN